MDQLGHVKDAVTPAFAVEAVDAVVPVAPVGLAAPVAPVGEVTGAPLAWELED